MKSSKPAYPRTLALVLTAGLTSGALVNTALAAATDKQDTVTISEYADWGSPAMAKIAVDSGRALIDHLMTARALLDTGNIPEARSALTASREFADAIERIMPYLTVVDDIKDARQNLIEEDVASFKDNLLPVYASLNELQVYVPEVAKRVREKVHAAEKNVQEGNRQQAVVTLKEAGDDIALHTVYLPVSYVDKQIHGALYALDQEKPDISTAKKALARALGSVVSVVDEVVESGQG